MPPFCRRPYFTKPTNRNGNGNRNVHPGRRGWQYTPRASGDHRKELFWWCVMSLNASEFLHQTNIEQTVSTFAKGQGRVRECETEREKRGGKKHLFSLYLCVQSDVVTRLQGRHADSQVVIHWSDSHPLYRAYGRSSKPVNHSTKWHMRQGIPHPVMRGRWSHQVAWTKNGD